MRALAICSPNGGGEGTVEGGLQTWVMSYSALISYSGGAWIGGVGVDAWAGGWVGGGFASLCLQVRQRTRTDFFFFLPFSWKSTDTHYAKSTQPFARVHRSKRWSFIYVIPPTPFSSLRSPRQNSLENQLRRVRRKAGLFWGGFLSVSFAFFEGGTALVLFVWVLSPPFAHISEEEFCKVGFSALCLSLCCVCMCVCCALAFCKVFSWFQLLDAFAKSRVCWFAVAACLLENRTMHWLAKPPFSAKKVISTVVCCVFGVFDSFSSIFFQRKEKAWHLGKERCGSQLTPPLKNWGRGWWWCSM